MTIEDIQEFCKSLKGVTESIKWDEDLCFCIGEKMFAVISLSGKDTLSFKVTAEEFSNLIETEHFIQAPYLGRYKWVFMENYNSIGEQELKQYIRQSYDLIRSKLSQKIISQIRGKTT